jgi:heat-inducible transcriptional repressor
MHELTTRQIQILKSLIEEYIETAEAVGSETLEKKHNLSASPATIRNEMVKLEELGYLKKPHTSSGRVPTPSAMKFYVKQLMKEKDLSVAEEVAMKERIWDFREKEQQCLRMLTKSLAEKTKTLAIATTHEGDIFAAGYANILEMPEFYDIDVTKNLLSALDEFDLLESLFANIEKDEEVHILLGEDLGNKLQGPYGFVFTRYHTPMHMTGEIGVFGPTRLNYTSVIPVVRYFGELIKEIATGW